MVCSSHKNTGARELVKYYPYFAHISLRLCHFSFADKQLWRSFLMYCGGSWKCPGGVLGPSFDPAFRDPPNDFQYMMSWCRSGGNMVAEHRPSGHSRRSIPPTWAGGISDFSIPDFQCLNARPRPPWKAIQRHTGCYGKPKFSDGVAYWQTVRVLKSPVRFSNAALTSCSSKISP